MREEVKMEVDKLNSETIISENVFEVIMSEDDVILRARITEELSDKAKLLGVKTKFDNILKAHISSEKQRKKQSTQDAALKRRQELGLGVTSTNTTKFNTEDYPDLFCGEWQTNGGIISMLTDYGQIIACWHPILPVRRLINMETGKEKLMLAYNKDGYWIEKIFDKGVIASANKIMCLADYGVAVTSETSKNLVKYLFEVENLNPDTIQKSFSTSKMGWLNGLEQFMPFNSGVEFDSEGTFEGLFRSISEKGNRTKYMDELKKVRATNRREPFVVMAASLASVMVKPTGMLPFILHLYNLSGKGKTVALMWAASIWGNPEINEFMSDPKNTRTAFELRLNFLNNLPFICDDTAQMKSFMNTQRNGDFSEFIYLVCSGKGKERSNVNLGINHINSWRNITITSGEKPITSDISNGGEINRVIDCKVDDGYIFHNGREMSNFLRGNYGFLGKEFIKVIQDLGVDYINSKLEECVGMLKNYNSELEKEEKQIAPVALLMLADRLMEEHIIKDGKFLPINYLVGLIKDTNQMSDMDRAFDFIIGEVEIHRKKFKGESDQCWGEFYGDYVLINSNTFSSMAERGNFNKKMFVEWGVDNGICSRDKDRHTKKFGNRNYYWIKIMGNDD